MEKIVGKDFDKLEDGAKAAQALIRAIMTGNESAKIAAYAQLQNLWDQNDIDELAIDVESLFRIAAG
ncbi:MAG TPA: hypothetical protein EYQ20_08455 [candidate division Zixibacteria bacterium]|jgi:hypothetical protein|nr:hypothetical protein [Candidatus Latescibacterota bacterium]MDP7236829.1 hypothetical protein [Candidatus Latescibacterota bacterium]HIG46432.1 hypothetical protein [candidate division Zixibacteria bacterium]